MCFALSEWYCDYGQQARDIHSVEIKESGNPRTDVNLYTHLVFIVFYYFANWPVRRYCTSFVSISVSLSRTHAIHSYGLSFKTSLHRKLQLWEFRKLSFVKINTYLLKSWSLIFTLQHRFKCIPGIWKFALRIGIAVVILNWWSLMHRMPYYWTMGWHYEK